MQLGLLGDFSSKKVLQRASGILVNFIVTVVHGRKYPLCHLINFYGT